MSIEQGDNGYGKFFGVYGVEENIGEPVHDEYMEVAFFRGSFGHVFQRKESEIIVGDKIFISSR